MINSINNSYSALKAIDTGMNVSSNNIANIDTNDFKSTQTIMKEGYKNGVVVSLSTNTINGTRIDDKNTTQKSNTDLTKEFTNQIRYQNSYAANLKAIQIADSTLGLTIDNII